VFIPYDLTRKDHYRREAAYTYIEDSAGARIELSASVPVIWDGKRRNTGKYGAFFYPGSFISVYFEKNVTVSISLRSARFVDRSRFAHADRA
jgi:hypothetical protein